MDFLLYKMAKSHDLASNFSKSLGVTLTTIQYSAFPTRRKEGYNSTCRTVGIY
jgi:hypothetical protein